MTDLAIFLAMAALGMLGGTMLLAVWGGILALLLAAYLLGWALDAAAARALLWWRTR
jgi:hypothetical protein